MRSMMGAPRDDPLMPFVRWHYRNGCYVRSHFRRAPQRHGGNRSLFPLAAASGIMAVVERTNARATIRTRLGVVATSAAVWRQVIRQDLTVVSVLLCVRPVGL